MAKACVYWCRQCRFIDGFDEFGEYNQSSAIYKNASNFREVALFRNERDSKRLVPKIEAKFWTFTRTVRHTQLHTHGPTPLRQHHVSEWCCKDLHTETALISNEDTIFVYSALVVSALASIDEVNLRRARLVRRWVTVFGFNSRCRTFISVCNQPATQGQLSLPSLRGSVNEYQLRLGRQKQVWFIPLADERGCAGKTVRSLENAFDTWAP